MLKLIRIDVVEENNPTYINEEKIEMIRPSEDYGEEITWMLDVKGFDEMNITKACKNKLTKRYCKNLDVELKR